MKGQFTSPQRFCPNCGTKLVIKKTRRTSDGDATWRRKWCKGCGARLSTIEYSIDFSMPDELRSNTAAHNIQKENEAEDVGRSQKVKDIEPKSPGRVPLVV